MERSACCPPGADPRGARLERQGRRAQCLPLHHAERRYKGIDIYAEVAKRFREAHPTLAARTEFVLCGKATKEDVSEVEALGISAVANVSDQELIDLYAAADIYMNFSQWEGYNLGIGQALALGPPGHRLRHPGASRVRHSVTDDTDEAVALLSPSPKRHSPARCSGRGSLNFGPGTSRSPNLPPPSRMLAASECRFGRRARMTASHLNRAYQIDPSPPCRIEAQARNKSGEASHLEVDARLTVGGPRRILHDGIRLGKIRGPGRDVIKLDRSLLGLPRLTSTWNFSRRQFCKAGPAEDIDDHLQVILRGDSKTSFNCSELPLIVPNLSIVLLSMRHTVSYCHSAAFA